MNYPCPRELAYLPDGASSLPEESPAFSNAAGAYILENWLCLALHVLGEIMSFALDGETKPGLRLCACPMQLSGPR